MKTYYADFVRGLFKDMGDLKLNLMHAAAGISGEAGEVIDAVKKHWAYDKPMDKDHLMEELGDTLFYIQAMINLNGWTVDEVINYNVTKLEARYHSGRFTNEQAIARADTLYHLQTIAQTDKETTDVG